MSIEMGTTKNYARVGRYLNLSKKLFESIETMYIFELIEGI